MPVQSVATVRAELLEQFQQEWAALARGLARPLPFHHPVWHRAWWAHFGACRTPVYLTVREGQTLAGVVPLMREGERLSLAGDPEVCDYTDVPVTPAAQVALLPEVLTAVDALPWRTFHVWGLPEDAPALAAIQDWAECRGYDVERDFEAVCPRVALAADWEGYLAGLSKKDRHELRRKLRRFAEAGGNVSLHMLRDPAELDGALDTFFHLHRISRHDKAQFMTPAMESFFREMTTGLAAEGLARLYLIEVNDAAVAALIAFRGGDELLLYNSGYDPAFAHVSVGLVSKAMALQSAIAEGLTTFDFLRGAEPYKYDLGATDRIVRQIWVRRNDD